MSDIASHENSLPVSPSREAINSAECHRQNVGSASLLAAILVGTFLILGISAAWIHSTYGSAACLNAKLCGEVVYLPEHSKVARVQFPNAANATFVLKNVTMNPITIIGADVDCRCMRVHSLPATVQPLHEFELAVDITPSQKDRGREVVQSALLYLDADGPRPRLTLRAIFDE